MEEASNNEAQSESCIKTTFKTVFLQHYDKRVHTYLPAENRNLKHPTNYCETYMHMLKASIGTGILAMPHAFSKSGYIGGIIGTVLIGLLCTYCERTIGIVQYELCQRNSVPVLDYMEMAQGAIREGPKCCRNFKGMKVLANALVLMFQLGCSCIYMIFVSTNVQNLVEYYTEVRLHILIYMCVDFICLIIMALIHNLKFLAILSVVANMSMIASFIILAVYIGKGHLTFENRSQFGSVMSFPLFIGTVMFSLEALGTIIPLSNGMKNPEQFTSLFGVLHFAMVPTIVLYVLVGLLGYLNYGDEIKGSITLNLPSDEVLGLVCKSMFVFAIFATNVLCVFITFEILWKSYAKWHTKEDYPFSIGNLFLIQYFVRVAVIILTFLFASLIPNLELFISLIGSLTLATAGIALPGIFSLYTYWEDYHGCSFAWFFSWCVFIVIMGIFACFIGVLVSFESIYVNVWYKMFNSTV